MLHRTIKKVTDDISALKFNTAIAQMMTFLNEVEKSGILRQQYETLLRLLAPFAPHIAEELWALAGKKKSIHQEKWPTHDAAKLKDETVVIAVQINGKTRGQVTVSSDADKSVVERAASESVKARLEGKKVARTIVVPGRLVNFVVEEN